jgi:hypothetical protein
MKTDTNATSSGHRGPTAAPISKNSVIIKRLHADHGQQSFKMFLPLNPEMVREVARNVGEIFDAMGGPSLLKSSRDVSLKPNVVGTNAYVYGGIGLD